MTQTGKTSSESNVLRLADLPNRKPTHFNLTPSSKELKELAAEIGLLDLSKVRFAGSLSPQGKSDWQLKAKIGATMVQPCVVTLEPVTTRVDEPLTRTYLSDFDTAFEAGSETEMPQDDTIERLPATIDLAQIMIEALALAAPLYPRAANADLAETNFTEPGKKALTDEDLKPFAGLAAVRDRLKSED